MSRKKSVRKHLEDGTYRADRHGAAPGEVPPVFPIAPKKPALSTESEAVWAELLAMVGNRVRPEDGPQLEQAAVWLAKWRLIVREMDTATPGTIDFSRLVSAASLASKSFDRIARKFGLTPLDRDSLNLPATDPLGATTW